ELRKLLLVVFSLAGMEIETLVPASFIEDTFFRIATEKLFANHRLAMLNLAFDDAHLIEQRNERGIFFHRRGNVMRAPRKRDHAIRTRTRRATGRAFEFDQYELFEARLL